MVRLLNEVLVTFTKAIFVPSGDHESGDDGAPGGIVTGKLHEPEVNLLASPPAAAINQMCDGVGAEIKNISLFPTSKASLPLSASALFDGSSEVTKTIDSPLGFQL